MFCYASENMESVTLEVFNAKVNGKMDGISEDEIVIAGEIYELSEYLIDNTSAVENNKNRLKFGFSDFYKRLYFIMKRRNECKNEHWSNRFGKQNIWCY